MHHENIPRTKVKAAKISIKSIPSAWVARRKTLSVDLPPLHTVIEQAVAGT